MPSRIFSLFALIRVTPSQDPQVIDPDVEFAMVRRAPPRPPYWGNQEIINELWSLGAFAPTAREGSVAAALETLALCDHLFVEHRTYTIADAELRASDWFREHLLAPSYANCQYRIEEDHASLLRREVITAEDHVFVVLFRGHLLIAAYTAPTSSPWTTNFFRMFR